MSHPIQTAGLDHIVLRIVDKEKMVAFYRDVLGCPVEWDRPDLGMTHMRVGASLLGRGLATTVCCGLQTGAGEELCCGISTCCGVAGSSSALPRA